jgi:hypothetical protein
MFGYKRKSGWSFVTSDDASISGGEGIGGGASTGTISLKDPGGQVVKFAYQPAGAGVGVGGE